MTDLDGAHEDTMDFGGLRIAFDSSVLRPRHWTVAQATWAAEISQLAPPGPVLELCSGVGQIGLLTVTLAPRRLVCVDADPAACAYLRRNAATAGLDVDVREGTMEDVLGPEEWFAVVIADPPWVDSRDTDEFPQDPDGAIDGGQEGLEMARRCLRVTDRHLLPGGAVVLQLGSRSQADQIASELASHDRLSVREIRDFPRGTLMRIDRASA